MTSLEKEVTAQKEKDKAAEGTEDPDSQDIKETQEPISSLSDIAGLDNYLDKEGDKQDKTDEIVTEPEDVDANDDTDTDTDKTKEKIDDKVNKDKKEIKTEKEGEKTSNTDWESKDNPYKKRQQETRSWGDQVSKAYSELETKNEKLTANIKDLREGLDIKEFEYKAPPPTVNELAKNQLNEKVVISEKAAIEFYGEGDKDKGLEAVKNLIGVKTEFPNLLKTDPEVYRRFTSSDSPIIEAIKIMKEREKLNYLGAGSLEEAKTKMRAELEKELETKNNTKDRLKHGPKGLPPGRGDKATGNTNRNTNTQNSLSSISGLG